MESRTKYLLNKCVFLPSHHSIWPFQTLRIGVHIPPVNGSLGPTEATTPGRGVRCICPAKLAVTTAGATLLPNFTERQCAQTPDAQCKYFKAGREIHLEIRPKKIQYIKPSVGTPFLWSRDHLMTGTQLPRKECWTGSQEIEICIPALLLAGFVTLDKSLLLASVCPFVQWSIRVHGNTKVPCDYSHLWFQRALYLEIRILGRTRGKREAAGWRREALTEALWVVPGIRVCLLRGRCTVKSSGDVSLR